MAAWSPEELESLLEDAVLLGDRQAIQALYDPRAVLVGPGWEGGPGRALGVLGGYVAGRLLVLGTVAVSVGEHVVTVSCCGPDRRWRIAASVTRGS